MKTKIKRHSRSVLSVILAISMLVSCMMVGIIATDAARVTDSGMVGAKIDNDSDTVGSSADSDEVGAKYADDTAVGAQASDDDEVGARMAEGSSVGWNGNAMIYTDKDSWGSARYTGAVDSSGNATVFVDLTEESAADSNGFWWFKLKVNSTWWGNDQEVNNNGYNSSLSNMGSDNSKCGKIKIGTAKAIKFEFKFPDSGSAEAKATLLDAMPVYIFGQLNGAASWSNTLVYCHYDPVKDSYYYDLKSNTTNYFRFKAESANRSKPYVSPQRDAGDSGGAVTPSTNSSSPTATWSKQYNNEGESFTVPSDAKVKRVWINVVKGNSKCTVWYETADGVLFYKYHTDTGHASPGNMQDQAVLAYKSGTVYTADLDPSAIASLDTYPDNAVIDTILSDNGLITGAKFCGESSWTTGSNALVASGSDDLISAEIRKHDASSAGIANARFARVSVKTGATVTGITVAVDTSAKSYTYSATGSFVKNIAVTAKDGAIRNHDTYGPYTTLAKIADTALNTTVIRDGEDVSIEVTDHPYASATTANAGATDAHDQDYQTATVESGDIIHVTTTINADNKAKYYVKGFIVNGETVATFQWNSTGVYEFDYTVTGEERNHKVEITPVYFLKDDSNTINFAIDGFEPSLQFTGDTPKWGDTLYVYPFYSYNGSFITGRLNAFGSYPGQPMVFDGGKYYIQIPKTIPYTVNSTSVTATVAGVTMSNGYWDHVHRSVMGWADNHDELHRQTYDYDDFYKIANELSPDNITYEFKYRTDTKNMDINTSSSYSSFPDETFGNGFDDLLDIYGRPIDIFGNLLTDAEAALSPVYVVSKGYKVTNAGSYATEWEIFYPNQEAAGATTWTKMTSGTVSAINPAALSLKNAARFATYGDADFSKYSGLYTALDSEVMVKRQPVKITFESEILNTEGDKAERSDGQWFHSKNNDVIHANIQIEYSADNGATWTADTYETPADASDVTGEITGGRAYFTNTEKNIAGNSYYEKRETGDVYSNNKEYFTFAAESSAGYKFVGWYRKVTTVKNGVTTTNYYAITGDAQSQKTTNDTYVARFMPYTGGSLTVNNTLYTAGTYKGNGTTQVKLDVINSNDASAAAIYTTGFQNRTATIGQDYIVENSSKYVRITLKTIPSGIDTFQQFSYNNESTRTTDAVATYFPNGGTTADTSYTLDGTTALKTIIVPISGLFGDNGEGTTVQLKNLLEYYSELSKWTLNYELKYYFDGREFGKGKNSQWYVVKGAFQSNEFNDYVTESGGHYYIARDFLSNKKPYERDFMKSITWNFDAASSASDTGVVTDNVNHTITYKWEIEQNNDEAVSTRRAIFTLPYCYNPNTGYQPNAYVPVQKYEQRTGSIGGVKYYVTAGFIYTMEEWEDYQAEMLAWKTSDTSSQYYNAEKYDANINNTWPYGKDSGDNLIEPTFGEPAFHDGIPIFDENEAIPSFDISTEYGKRFVVGDYPSEEQLNNEEAYNYIVAAPSVWKDNSIKYFSYWKITNNDGKEIAKCYAHRFNFSAYDNYQITAIYEGTVPGSNLAGGYSEAPGATISYLDDSRNHWNEGGGGSNTAYQASGDVLFKDFAVAYTYDSEVFNTYTDKRIRVGVAIEWVKNGEDGNLIETIGGSTITDMKFYEDKYSSTEATAITNIKGNLLGTSSTSNIYIKPIASNIAAIDDTADTGYLPLSNTEIIDNKNRLKYHYAIYNEANGTSYSTKYGSRLYRAYAYIMIDLNNDGDFADEGEIAVSAKPVYFTFNDVANRKSDY